MTQNIKRRRFEIIEALRDVGQFVNEGTGHWVYPRGLVIELNPAVFSQDDIPDVENQLCEELQKNFWAFRLQVVPEHPLRDEAAVILGRQLPKAEAFRVRRQSFTELFTNELRREGFITGDRLDRRVLVRFHRGICEEIRGRPVNGGFFRSVLENYSQEQGFFIIEESLTPVDRGYTLLELEEAPANLSGGPGFLDVKPYRIRNSTHTVVYIEIRSLSFSSVKGVALLPGQTLRVLQGLDVETVRRQFELSSRQTSGDLIGAISLPESEFDLLPRQSIVFKPLSLPFRPRPTTRLFPGEREKYHLLYVGARVRSLRTEIYISDLFDLTLNPPMAITVGYTHADRARWYSFNQPCELQVSEPSTFFRVLPGYLFRADHDQLRIRNIHLAFKSPHNDKNMADLPRCEIMVEPSGEETLIMVQKPKPVVVAAFSEYDVQDIRLGQDRFQLRIARSNRRKASTTRAEPIREEPSQGLTQMRTDESHAVLKVRDIMVRNDKPWKSIAFDEPFVIGNHIFKVITK